MTASLKSTRCVWRWTIWSPGARYAAAVEGEAPAVAAAPAVLTIVNGRHPLLLAAAVQDSSADRRTTDPPSRRAAEPPRTVVPFDLSLDLASAPS